MRFTKFAGLAKHSLHPTPSQNAMIGRYPDTDRYRPPQLARTTIWEKVQLFGFLIVTAGVMIVVTGS